jgi:hypothetical protein
MLCCFISSFGETMVFPAGNFGVGIGTAVAVAVETGTGVPDGTGMGVATGVQAARKTTARNTRAILIFTNIHFQMPGVC